LLTHSPSDKNEIKEQTENIKGMSLVKKKKEGQLVTGGIFYCRDSAGFSVSTSNKLSSTKTYRQTVVCHNKSRMNKLSNLLNWSEQTQMNKYC